MDSEAGEGHVLEALRSSVMAELQEFRARMEEMEKKVDSLVLPLLDRLQLHEEALVTIISS